MKNKKTFIAVIILAVSAALCLRVYIGSKFIKTYTYTEIEYRGYTSKDVKDIKVDHSYIRLLLGYNEWRISAEFKEEPDVFFWFSYRDKKIIFEGVSAQPMLDKDMIIEYSEKFKNGTLLKK